ncbi:MAG: scyllo-inositol 2-dehydrogenase [Gaiellales bacterium]|jgi:scyllo-inositol 2-dehydrogenase (NADP+)|nr:scyllo-inositol 2-dehydrogenase [Gaiellales bacterium]
MADGTPIRTAIIGYGLSGRIFHAPFIAANPRFSLEAISTSDPGRRAEAAREHPGAEIAGSPEELLAQRFDLVVLGSPAHVHLEQGLSALALGAALVVDKPFAASVTEAEQLIAAATSSGRPLVVFQNRRWDGDFLTLRKLLRDGALGEVHRFDSAFERWSPELRPRWQDTTTTSQGAGIVFDLGSHLIDQALQLFGPARLTTAELSILRPGGVSADEAFLSLLHDSGTRSHLTMSRYATRIGPRFRVLGSTAGYMIHGLDVQEPALVAGASPADANFGLVPAEAWGTLGIEGSDAPPVRVPTERGDYGRFYAHVADAIRDGAPPPVDPHDALATLRIITRAHELAGI